MSLGWVVAFLATVGFFIFMGAGAGSSHVRVTATRADNGQAVSAEVEVASVARLPAGACVFAWRGDVVTGTDCEVGR